MNPKQRTPLSAGEQALTAVGILVGAVAFSGVLIVLTDYQNIFKRRK